MPTIEFVSSSEYGLRHDECVWVSRYAVPAEVRFGDHAHLESQLVWVGDGQMIATVGDRRWVLSPSQALWIPSGLAHDLEAVRDSDVHIMYVWSDECPRDWPGPVPMRMSSLARELLRYLALPHHADDAARRARAMLLDVLEPLRIAPIDLPMPREERSRQIAVAVLSEPGLPHTLSAWARRLHTSEKTIQRSFTSQTGMTFSEWRIQARLFCSLRLLADAVPVAAVAGRIGYTSTNGFTSAFRSRFGTTPGSFFTHGLPLGEIPPGPFGVPPPVAQRPFLAPRLRPGVLGTPQGPVGHQVRALSVQPQVAVEVAAQRPDGVELGGSPHL